MREPGAPTGESTREGSNGSGPDAQLPGVGSGVEPAPSPSVPTTSLRFGSFEPASAPPRLWSDRVDSDDVFEHTLPLLEFEGAGGSLHGPMVTATSPRPLVRAGDVEPMVASPPPVSPVVEVPEMISTPELGLGGGESGQVASTTPISLPSPVIQVLEASAGVATAGPRQVASAISSPVAAMVPATSVALGGRVQGKWP